MKLIELVTLFREVKQECGDPNVCLVAESDAFIWPDGKRLGSDSYKVMHQFEGDKPISGIMIKYRDRSPKVVARFIYQAIAEILWPSIPYWKHRWFGLVMATDPKALKYLKHPPGALDRDQLIIRARAQAKRNNGHS